MPNPIYSEDMYGSQKTWDEEGGALSDLPLFTGKNLLFPVFPRSRNNGFTLQLAKFYSQFLYVLEIELCEVTLSISRIGEVFVKVIFTD